MPYVAQSTSITVQCASCRASVVLKCEGLYGVAAYPIYSQYVCPHCGKQDTAKTPGHIITVEPL